MAEIKTFKQFREGAVEQNELELYVDNTSDIYHKYVVPAVDKIRKLYKAGKDIDLKRAAKLFGRAVDEGAKLYNKEIGEKNFSKKDRDIVAMNLAKSYVEEVRLGN